MIKPESRAYYIALGARVAQLRKQNGMTQAELARALGVSQQSVFAYELGERRITVALLKPLSEALVIPVQDLIDVAKPARVARRRLPSRIVDRVKRIQELSRSDQRFLFRLVDSLLERRNH